MPVYEYECMECGQIEEAFQKISEAPLSTCSHCNGRLKKLISHSAFHLKGSGWYVTDYGGAKNGTSVSSDTVSTDKSSGNNKSSSDNKTACSETACSGKCNGAEA